MFRDGTQLGIRGACGCWGAILQLRLVPEAVYVIRAVDVTVLIGTFVICAGVSGVNWSLQAQPDVADWRFRGGVAQVRNALPYNYVDEDDDLQYHMEKS